MERSISGLATLIDDCCLCLKQCTASVNSRASLGTLFDDSGNISVLPVLIAVADELNSVVKEKPCYERVDVNDYCSPDPKKKHDFIQSLLKGLTVPAVMYTYNIGSNIGNYYFCRKMLSKQQ